jgi:hypothetical protein
MDVFLFVAYGVICYVIGGAVMLYVCEKGKRP